MPVKTIQLRINILSKKEDINAQFSGWTAKAQNTTSWTVSSLLHINITDPSSLLEKQNLRKEKVLSSLGQTFFFDTSFYKQDSIIKTSLALTCTLSVFFTFKKSPINWIKH